jgi:hypothetical protein
MRKPINTNKKNNTITYDNSIGAEYQGENERNLEMSSF